MLSGGARCPPPGLSTTLRKPAHSHGIRQDEPMTPAAPPPSYTPTFPPGDLEPPRGGHVQTAGERAEAHEEALAAGDDPARGWHEYSEALVDWSVTHDGLASTEAGHVLSVLREVASTAYAAAARARAGEPLSFDEGETPCEEPLSHLLDMLRYRDHISYGALSVVGRRAVELGAREIVMQHRRHQVAPFHRLNH